MSTEVELVDAVLAVLPSGCAVHAVERLTGGASRETFRVDAERDGSPWPLILQRERGEPRRPEGMAAEASVVRAALAAGVTAPVVVVSHGDVDPAVGDAVGASWFITEAVEGETIARRILRDDDFSVARTALPVQLGTALAGIHRAEVADLAWIETRDELAEYRTVADELGLAIPAFELAFRWLENNRPEPVEPVLVHGDFRLGNLIVDDAGLSAVIDWELAHVGDPMEDLGWVCVRAWRFGGPKPVAGLGDYAELFDAYEAASGRSVDPEVVRWWELLGTLKWGIMCGSQVGAHRDGVARSVELAAIGRRIVEQEYDVLRLLGAAAGPIEDAQAESADAAIPSGPTTAAELVEAVGEFLRGDVMADTVGRVSFHARVAANALAIVGRELAAKATLDDAQATMLAAVQASSPAALAAAVRAGEHDHRLAETAQVVIGDVAARLAVANPKWL